MRNIKKGNEQIIFQGFLFMFVLLLSGCALSPQIVVINPDIEVTSVSTETKPVRLQLDVVDSRGSEFIGKRGGLYKDTSDISTDSNMTASLERTLASALNSLGYMVARKGEASDAVLTVRINAIQYTTVNEKLLYKVEAHTEIQAVCSKSSRQFTGGYRATRKKDYVKVPSMGENETLVNEAIAVALQAMLKDQELLNFIDG